MPIKCKYKVKFYYRYCDDIVILSSDKEYLWKLHCIINNILNKAKLDIKPNYRIAPLNQGLDYLGFVIYSGIYSRVRKRIKLNAKKKLCHIVSKYRKQEIIAAIKGYCLYCNGHNLFNTLIIWH
jgi:hypothetical protein